MKNRILSPSLLSADLSNLASGIEIINNSQAQWVHIDVMDGLFVPNITYGQPVIKAMRDKTDKIFDTHLMITEPGRYVESFVEAGSDIVTIHIEADNHINRTLSLIKSLGAKAGIALNPHTPVVMLEEVVELADLILVMSVNPGFGGQKFIPSSLDKISRVKELLLKKNSDALIEVDGGVTLDNAASLFEAGADALVAGNAVYGSSDPIDTISKILRA